MFHLVTLVVGIREPENVDSVQDGSSRMAQGSIPSRLLVGYFLEQAHDQSSHAIRECSAQKCAPEFEVQTDGFPHSSHGSPLFSFVVIGHPHSPL